MISDDVDWTVIGVAAVLLVDVLGCCCVVDEASGVDVLVEYLGRFEAVSALTLTAGDAELLAGSTSFASFSSSCCTLMLSKGFGGTGRLSSSSTLLGASGSAEVELDVVVVDSPCGVWVVLVVDFVVVPVLEERILNVSVVPVVLETAVVLI